MSGYASLVFLSYNRPQFIFESIRSATANAGYPCEVIVHDDGSTAQGVAMGLLDMLHGQEISHLILNVPGHNEGVGTAINRGFKLATGDPIIKLDQDLLYEPGWLARTVEILRDPEIGMLGLFKYAHQPVVWREKLIEDKGLYHYTRQLVGSAMAIPRRVYEACGPFKEHSDAFAEDVEYMMERVPRHGYTLALPNTDLVKNRGFGLGPSTVALKDASAPNGIGTAKIHHGPFVVGGGGEESGVVQVETARKGSECAGQDGPEPSPQTPRKFDVGVVITTCAGREQNLRRTVEHLARLDRKPETVVVVYDGCGPQGFTEIAVHGVEIPKHSPGQEQPRNVGFRTMRAIAPECNYVWFLDSDLVFEPDILTRYYEGLCAAEEDRILLGPYEWMSGGRTTPDHGLHNDFRIQFSQYGPDTVLRHDLGAALANLGGNLIWPVEPFQAIGGFHPDLHHGRCEDGELGLRAASAGVPMSFVRDARAWHVQHPVNSQAVRAKNARDVPLINKWHPWVEQQGLIVTEADGARFEGHCPHCGELMNNHLLWAHMDSCPQR